MSVFLRPGSKTYSYDFRHNGQRFSGSTDRTTKPAAREVEKAKRKEAEANSVDDTKPLTFRVAGIRYWEEKGQFASDPDGPFLYIAWLDQQIGGSTLVSKISNATVARLVAKRREDGVSNATINRSVVEPLRTILRRAKRVWGATVQEIEWGEHRLKEPQERVREASHEEEDLALSLLPEDYRPILRFALLTGCRRGEIVGLEWSSVYLTRREFRVTGKGDVSRTIPMTQKVYELLLALHKAEDAHKTAVFTYRAERTRQGRIRGTRYPITAEGFNTVWARYVRPKLDNFRFHDARHTAATRVVRATGNLKAAQKLLGHTNIATTTRYAHVSHEDLLSALETVDRAENATRNATKRARKSAKMLKSDGDAE